MSNYDLIIIRTYILDNYVVEILGLQDFNISTEILDSLQNSLNILEYPKDIVSSLEPIKDIKYIQVYDKNNNLLITSNNNYLW